MKVRHINHIGIVVHDLDDAKDFFVDLGFSIVGETPVQGEWVDRIIGLKGAKSDIVMLQAPDGHVLIELSKFYHPIHTEHDRKEPANKPGLRHIALEVDDVEAIVKMLQQKGRELVGEVVTYADTWKLCYVRGPEGIIIELAEQI